MNKITYIENFTPNSNILFHDLLQNIAWDERMTSRLTASFGVAYNYSQISYPFKQMPETIADLCERINAELKTTGRNATVKERVQP